MLISKINSAYIYLDHRPGRSGRELKIFLFFVSALPFMCVIVLFLSPYVLVVEIPSEIAKFGFSLKLKAVAGIFIFAWFISLYYVASFWKLVTWELPQLVNWIKQDNGDLLIKPIIGETVRIPVNDYQDIRFERLPQRYWHFLYSYIRTRSGQCYKLNLKGGRFFYVVEEIADAYQTKQKLDALKGSGAHAL